MSLDVKTNQYEEYLEVIVTGQYDMQDAIDKFPQVLDTCRLSGLSKVIIDFRELQGLPAATEKVIYAFGVEKHYVEHLSSGGQALQVAYVGKAPFVSTYEPGVEIAQSSGLPFRLFENINEAFEWLGVKPT